MTYSVSLALVGACGLLAGFGLGILATYLLTVSPLIRSMNRLRFAGWTIDRPIPERPKTVPVPEGEDY